MQFASFYNIYFIFTLFRGRVWNNCGTWNFFPRSVARCRQISSFVDGIPRNGNPGFEPPQLISCLWRQYDDSFKMSNFSDCLLIYPFFPMIQCNIQSNSDMILWSNIWLFQIHEAFCLWFCVAAKKTGTYWRLELKSSESPSVATLLSVATWPIFELKHEYISINLLYAYLSTIYQIQ